MASSPPPPATPSVATRFTALFDSFVPDRTGRDSSVLALASRDLSRLALTRPWICLSLSLPPRLRGRQIRPQQQKEQDDTIARKSS